VYFDSVSLFAMTCLIILAGSSVCEEVDDGVDGLGVAFVVVVLVVVVVDVDGLGAALGATVADSTGRVW